MRTLLSYMGALIAICGTVILWLGLTGLQFVYWGVAPSYVRWVLILVGGLAVGMGSWISVRAEKSKLKK